MGPQENLSRIHRIHGQVFARLVEDELKISLLPGSGMASQGPLRDVPIEMVPIDSRLPNSLLWVTLGPGSEILQVEHRDADDATPMSF